MLAFMKPFRTAPQVSFGVFLVLSGCGGGDGFKISRPAAQRPDWDDQRVAKSPLRLPADEPLNVVLFKSGQEGAARGTASASERGVATAAAEANNDGSAWGEFQIGHCFDNISGRRMTAVVRVRLAAKRKVAAPPEEAQTTAQTTLTFFVKDSNGATLHQESVAGGDSRKGPAEWSGDHEFAFDAVFAPDLGYYLFLAARADARGADGRSASASVEVSRCELTLEWGPVRSARSGDDAQRVSTVAP